MVSVHKSIEHVIRISTRLLLVAVIFYQGVGLNSLVVEHWSRAKTLLYVFTLIDVVNCLCLSVCIWLAYFAIRTLKWMRKNQDGENQRPESEIAGE